MNRNAILNAMEKRAKTIFENSDEYYESGKRGMFIVEIRDAKNPNQWDSSRRNFGVTFRDYTFSDELVINNGTNFDALAHGKVAFTRRTQKNSGTNYYQVLGYESFWPGSIISDDENCICAFAGLSAADDQEIAKAGITCYESLKRTGKSLAMAVNEEEESDEAGDDDDESDFESDDSAD